MDFRRARRPNRVASGTPPVTPLLSLCQKGARAENRAQAYLVVLCHTTLVLYVSVVSPFVLQVA